MVKKTAWFVRLEMATAEVTCDFVAYELID